MVGDEWLPDLEKAMSRKRLLLAEQTFQEGASNPKPITLQAIDPRCLGIPSHDLHC